MPAPWRTIELIRVHDGGRREDTDRAATEAPLAIRVQGEPFVITMRTPGDDASLAAGFLLSEQVVKHADEIAGIEVDPGGDTVDVRLAGDAPARLAARAAERRQVTATSACGVCGRPTLDALRTDAAPLTDGWTVPASLVASLPDRLRAAQAVFDHTGGLHAAGLFALDGTLVHSAEDVGRHNAVDKVVGRQVLAGAVPLGTHILCVSGRASFELVQKAVLAGIPVLVAVSAPSTLAIDLAEERGLTLAGFTRGDGFNLYTHPHRIA
ncbi:sulfurtransferase FdhD [Luteitalea sp. TBR-22]|uniref:formate dehydrogenase accessory sulfurtransferase FdhD n=1 Tax=Luteitalea sp. TBR-22 TaxID=2802971 RepID=UPI001AF80314|nr:formate dehydrogenase accessory sulfurtransferase FdhD [Luteitalea sp. TBR-22]BCS31798.1 sulfurtransferase FdhD [Luteitalea sp. TBR-22]